MSADDTTRRRFEIGAFTFGQVTAPPGSSAPADPSVRLRKFIALAELADRAGLDVAAIGTDERRTQGVLA